MSATLPEIICEIWVCYDCHFHHHTKEVSPETETVPWCQLPTADVTDYSDTKDFSAAPCPACNSNLAGSRHKYAIWE